MSMFILRHSVYVCSAFSALMLLVGRQEEWWGVDVVICLQRGADCLRIVQLLPLHPETQSSLASFKSRLVLPFWYQLTQVVLETRPLNGCSLYMSTHSFALCWCCRWTFVTWSNWLSLADRWRHVPTMAHDMPFHQHRFCCVWPAVLETLINFDVFINWPSVLKLLQ